ncbi:Do family serine endopeptidase [Mesorhizobium sp. VK25A]|uniref:Do family serine endopeptidase n=1 Tax=Mesorhizobium vachelliae TaxID=3072309 RepID=A0ABU5A650_9HYPH|nr:MULTISPECIES: Do family serine endopeptidase [unclassified Mesorhizobium]MDX8533135.1 Do family serine endopeptidase [Mesorhizobium sp. VK25D]MDX8545054.1 Do family serine endopeptidase [Mesorhizobium sp. VK25A]
MNIVPNSYSRTRRSLVAAVASLTAVGAVGVGAVVCGTAPVLADAVHVQAPQMPSFADVVEQVSPAVVSVKVKSTVQPTADDGSDGQDGFDNLPDNQQQPGFKHGDGKPRPVAQGSGFFISEDGYLVTNNHVVSEGSSFTVVTNDGKELDAKLIGTDPRTDLAVLKVDGGNKFTYVDFADDSKIRIGDWVVAVGNPFGLGGTVTSGIVSARGRDIGAGPYDDFIQIDAPVNHGNSGGPTFNLNGQVIGINTAIFSPSGGSVGIGFDIPASTAKLVVKDLMKEGSIKRGWLGVQIQPLTAEIAESLGLKSDKGVLVSNAQDAAPGKKAGIVAGDVITQVDGKDVASPKDLARTIGAYAPGKSVDLAVWRDGKSQTIKVNLGTLPSSDKQASSDDGKQAAPAKVDALADLGLTIAKSDDGKGLIVTDVDPNSDAADRGIQPGDVITAINSAKVSNADDVSKAMTDAAKAGRKAVLMQITRDDSSRFVALPVGKA